MTIDKNTKCSKLILSYIMSYLKKTFATNFIFQLSIKNRILKHELNLILILLLKHFVFLHWNLQVFATWWQEMVNHSLWSIHLHVFKAFPLDLLWKKWISRVFNLKQTNKNFIVWKYERKSLLSAKTVNVTVFPIKKFNFLVLDLKITVLVCVFLSFSSILNQVFFIKIKTSCDL